MVNPTEALQQKYDRDNREAREDTLRHGGNKDTYLMTALKEDDHYSRKIKLRIPGSKDFDTYDFQEAADDITGLIFYLVSGGLEEASIEELELLKSKLKDKRFEKAKRIYRQVTGRLPPDAQKFLDLQNTYLPKLNRLLRQRSQPTEEDETDWSEGEATW